MNEARDSLTGWVYPWRGKMSDLHQSKLRLMNSNEWSWRVVGHVVKMVNVGPNSGNWLLHFCECFGSQSCFAE
jgi:hypothetical protein